MTLAVPGLLRDSIGGRASVSLEAATVAEALARLRSEHPLLTVHVFDEDGDVREHVFLALNGRSLGRSAAVDAPLADGDRLDVVQAVSGG